MSERLQRMVESGDRPWIVPYLTAGFPRAGETVDLLSALAEGGASAIEIGLPFSDPLADGPVIQHASTEALRGGASHEQALELAARFRARSDVPLIFMGYVNPILAFGAERFFTRSVEAGIDGLIVPDLPLEEAAFLHGPARDAGLSWIFLAAPTSSEDRLTAIDRLSSHLNYCVSVTGVTGARADLPPDMAGYLERCARCMTRPFVVGFGVSRPEQVASLCPPAAGVVVGSALIQAIGDEPTPEGRRRVARDFVKALRP